MSYDGNETLKDIMVQLKKMDLFIRPMVRDGSVYKKGKIYTIFHGPVEMLASFLIQIENDEIGFDQRVIDKNIGKMSWEHLKNKDPKKFYKKEIQPHLVELHNLTSPFITDGCPYTKGKLHTEFHKPLNYLQTIIAMYEDGVIGERTYMLKWD